MLHFKMKNLTASFLVSMILLSPSIAFNFQPTSFGTSVQTTSSSRGQSKSCSKVSMSADVNNNNANTKKATLTEETTWRLRFALNNVPTMNNRKVGELFVVDVQFMEEEGYEPPQGPVKQIKPNLQQDDSSTSSSNIRYLEITNGRWKLSEDPNDRKDGLWIWGLFKEPQYPYLLLQIETEAYPLPGSDGDSIQPLTLYAQINHKRDRKTGEVELEASALNLREIEQVKVDPFGAATASIFEDVKIGQLSLRPLL